MAKPSPVSLKKYPKNTVKLMQMAIGVDLIGSKMSMATRPGVHIEATAVGLKMRSKTSKRVVLIPYANCKGLELYWDEEEDGKFFEDGVKALEAK